MEQVALPTIKRTMIENLVTQLSKDIQLLCPQQEIGSVSINGMSEAEFWDFVRNGLTEIVMKAQIK